VRAGLGQVDEHAGVEDAFGVDGGFGGSQRRGERLGALPVIPWPVIAADGMVIG